ncbi:MAG: hypothetical protein GX660_05490 [Clostridiaceae bacterium]|nr:hypothetical protein [Clostridiaceae bacterium]
MIKINLDEPLTYKNYIGRWDSNDDYYKPCEIDYVYGMHCTKILNDDILKYGLRILNIDEQIEYVKNALISNGTSKQITKCFLATLNECYDEEDKACRENQICFVLNRSAIFDEIGCEDFFKYFGGECIYRVFKFRENCIIKNILSEIGKPVIIHAWVPYDSIEHYQRANIIDFINGCNLNGCEVFSNSIISTDNIIKIEGVNVNELINFDNSSYDMISCPFINL